MSLVGIPNVQKTTFSVNFGLKQFLQKCIYSFKFEIKTLNPDENIIYSPVWWIVVRLRAAVLVANNIKLSNLDMPKICLSLISLEKFILF